MCGLDGWNTSHHCGLKCKQQFMLFKHSRQVQNLPEVVTLDGQKIEKVACYKYLGFLLDEKVLTPCREIGKEAES